jgi:hypothetical protein
MSSELIHTTDVTLTLAYEVNHRTNCLEGTDYADMRIEDLFETFSDDVIQLSGSGRSEFAPSAVCWQSSAPCSPLSLAPTEETYTVTPALSCCNFFS